MIAKGVGAGGAGGAGDGDVVLVANPVAGRGLGRKRAEEMERLLRARGVRVRLEWSVEPGHAQGLAERAAKAGFAKVVACGGDGTVNEVANALVRSDTILGIVPAGRGNDLARALRLPSKLSQLAEALVRGNTQMIDLGLAGERCFCISTTLGFDAEVSRVVREEGCPFCGMATYLFALLKTLLHYRHRFVRLSGDFGEFEGEIFLAATANAPAYGGGLRIAPSACMDDGVLDVCLIRPISRLTVLALLPLVFSGKHVKHPAVELLRTRWLRIQSPEPLWVYADGEPMGQTPMQIGVIPQALRVVCVDSPS